MEDIASLALKVDARDVKNAGYELNKLTDAGKKAETGAKGLATAYKAAGAAIAALGLLEAVRALESSVKAANEYEKAIKGLSSVARYAGQDLQQTLRRSMTLTEDGLLSTAEAATALKNLLARGFSTDQAVTMINRFKDSAAFGRQSSLEFGQAVVSATEGIKNENSVLVDNAGVTKNVSVMWKEYAAQIGKTVNNLSIAEKRQAEYNGVLRETAAQMGNAAQAAEGYDGAVARRNKAINDVLVAIGKAFTQTATEINNVMASIAGGVLKSVDLLVASIKGLTVAVGAFTAMKAASAIYAYAVAMKAAEVAALATAEAELVRTNMTYGASVASKASAAAAVVQATAMTTLTGRVVAATVAIRAFMLSNPIGWITLLLGAGATAWFMWGDSAEKAGKKANESADKALSLFQKYENVRKAKERERKAAEDEAAQAFRDNAEKRKKIYDEAVKANADYIDSLIATTKAIDDETKSVVNKAIEMEFETTLIGKTAEEVNRLTAEREAAHIAMLKEKLAVAELAGNRAGEADAIRDQVTAYERLNKAKGSKIQAEAAAKANMKAIEEQTRAHEEMWKSIEGVAHDTWTRIWTEGSNAFTNIGKTIKSAILDMLYQMTVKKWIIGVSMTGTATGASASGMSGLVESGSGFNIPGLDFGGSALTTLGNAIGSSLISGVGTGMSIGWSAASTAASAYSAAGMAMEGLALQIGAALPWIGGALVIGSALGLFGGSKPQSTPLGASWGRFDAAGTMVASGSGGGVDQSTARSNAAIADMEAQYLALADALGIAKSATSFYYGLGIHADKSGMFGTISGSAGGSTYTTSNVGTEAQVQLAASRAVFAAVKGSQLPGYLATVFNSVVVSTATQQQLDGVLQYAQALKQMRESLLETRTPLEILRQNITDAMVTLNTSAASFKTDFVAAIDAGLSPATFAKWAALGAAIEQLKVEEATGQLTSAWQSLTDAIFAEVRRIRGLIATPTSTAAQFATLTAQARAGDKNAAELLPGVARAMLDVAAMTASSATDLARLQGRTSASLETTGMTLASKYGLTIPAFATGTAEVPVDMVAQIHKGERITPKAFVDEDKAAREETNALLRKLQADIADVKTTNRRMLQTEEKWDIDGLPDVRVA